MVYKQAISCQHKVPPIFEKLIACLNQTPITLGNFSKSTKHKSILKPYDSKMQVLV
jgi:hypothetical protein